jgi:hypothetical protein
MQSFTRGTLLAVLLGAVACTGLAQQSTDRQPVQVKIQDEQEVVTEIVLPIDPVKRIRYQPTGLGVSVQSEQGQTLHLSHYPTIHVDGRLHMQGEGGQVEVGNKPLPKDPIRKYREGFVSVYRYGDLRVTTTVTLVPTKPAQKAAKRRLDAVVVHYQVENKGNVPHKFGLRVYMDTYVIDNDGCMFAAPTMPGKVLDGMELKGKDLPDYVQLLQRPDLKNPGFVAHLTLNLGSKLEKPERVVLTRHGAGFGGWDMPVFASQGDSGMGVFWQPAEIKPGGKREFAYGYGQGIATTPESEGRVEVQLGGSFEPGKLFTVTAHVTDPALGQSLLLELPQGMELVEGKQCQPVPAAVGDEPYSLVLWKARVVQPGEYVLRVRSSTGVTLGKRITITRAGA